MIEKYADAFLVEIIGHTVLINQNITIFNDKTA